jgi:hypothetical protein
MGAFLRAIIDVLEVKRLLDDFVTNFGAFDIILVNELVNHVLGDLHVRTTFVDMVFTLTFCAENKSANCTMALVFIFVDLSWVLALRAPPEVVHLVNGFRDRVFVELFHH